MRFVFGIALWTIVIPLIFAASPFQQEVRYQIQAKLDPDTKKLWARTFIWYRNNSPDTLSKLYFHLYWNLFAENSYGRQKSRQRSWITPPVKVLAVYRQRRPNKSLLYKVDNTVMEIIPPTPLRPGDTVALTIEIEETIPLEGMRMGYWGSAFSIAHWFPSICVYDRYGWHKYQYLGTGEFYEEFADFDVQIQVPAAYAVFATGELVNAEDVLPAPVRARLDSARRYKVPVRIADLATLSQQRPDTVDTLVWHWRAQNVRSFAFTVYKDYLWDAQGWNNTTIHVVYPKRLEDFYATDGLKAAVFAVQFLSQHVGPYPYPNMFVTVGGASGGMEYPGIVFMTRWLGGGVMRKITTEIIIHEVVHNWFPMMLNTNEQEYAFMDEGFTTFFTTLAVEAFLGRYENQFPRETFWERLVLPPMDQRTDMQLQAIRWAFQEQEEPVMTHSERYATGQAYRVNSYSKTASVLLMLQYVMGDRAFQALFREYYRRYRFRHVEPQDFFALAMEIDHRWNGRRDLRWFFDQWFEKTYTLDYALTDFSWERRKKNLYTVTVEITNRGRAIMPADVVIDLEDGRKDTIWFSEEDFFKGTRVVRKSKMVRSKPVYAEINPDGRLLDIKRYNNTSDWPLRASLEFAPWIQDGPKSLKYYRIHFFPALWFNNTDKLQLGISIGGNYLQTQHAFHLQFLQGLRFGPSSTGFIREYTHTRGGNTPQYFLRSALLEGRSALLLGVKLKDPLLVTAEASYFNLFDSAYVFRYQWNPDNQDTTELLSQWWWWIRGSLGTYIFGRNGTFQLRFEGGSRMSPGAAVPYVRWDGYWQQQLQLPLLGWKLNFRLYGGFSPTPLPAPKAFRLASATPFESYWWDIYRSHGILSQTFLRNRHGAYGGALLRGYADQDQSGSVVTAVNLSLNVDPLMRMLPRYIQFLGSILRVSLFYDAGMIWKDPQRIRFQRRWYQDAGVSVSLLSGLASVARGFSGIFHLFRSIGITDIRFDFPFFVSHPKDGEKPWQFRWRVSFRHAL